MSTTTRNLEIIHHRIREASHRVGRDPESVRLIVVSKYRSLEEIETVVGAGEMNLGESRIQEATEKIPELSTRLSVRPVWHLIGHLQTNKARVATGLFDMVHSVDSLRIAEALNDACEKQQRAPLDILLQVNISGEESKYGLTPDSMPETLRSVAALKHIQVRGLMTMAPFESEPEATRSVFRDLRLLRDRLRELNLPGVDLRELSMGMTNDFEVAVEEGATLVRIGTAVFEGF